MEYRSDLTVCLGGCRNIHGDGDKLQRMYFNGIRNSEQWNSIYSDYLTCRNSNPVRRYGYPDIFIRQFVPVE